MALLIDSASTYLAQMIGQMVLEKAEMMARIDKLEADGEQVKADAAKRDEVMAPLLDCIRSGQVSAEQLAEHMKDPVFAAYYRQSPERTPR
jgi:hypothetical protein